ncbi:MAG: rhomboid family intramembrane serine protease [Bacteroidota bacterium]|nr:rhomboid family intramembrane serine protease [Bacteroidota bacterium]
MQVNFPQILGLRYIYSPQFEPYQIFAHIFVHADGWHLFSNMFALFIFGPLLEKVWGANRFLVFYLVTGLGASVLFSAVNYYEIRKVEVDAHSYMEAPEPDAFDANVSEHFSSLHAPNYEFIDAYSRNPEDRSLIEKSLDFVNQTYNRVRDIPMVGASGAVFGILMAFGYLFPNLQLMLLFPPIPIKAKYLVLFYGLYSLYAAIQKVPGDNVAHYAHLGGMLFAIILLKMWGQKPNNYY